MNERLQLALPECRLLESVVTTLCANGEPNISPIGPLVDDHFRHLLLRPYPTSTTFRNLTRTGEGVLHVTDNVELFAQAAIGQPDPTPRMEEAKAVCGRILVDACRWYAFRIDDVDDSTQPAQMTAHVVDGGRLRDFFGFNRAMHAVIEAAILATRIEYLPREEILAEFDRLAVLVRKTGGYQEHRAFEHLDAYVRSGGRPKP
jgi:hypothetical protein